MTDRTGSGRSVRGGSRLRLFRAPSRRVLLRVAVVILVLGGAIGTFLFARHLANRDIVAARQLIEQLQSESQKLQRQVIDQNILVTALQTKLKSVQDTLESIMPSENTYNVNPNQSTIVANGHLTIGLVGSPGNESVDLNINGKQQSVSAGQIVNVAIDASTNCQVGVQSFDMFKAIITASCAAVKPQ